ncbi:MAG: hypothetical protein ACTSPB_17130 [Candidatus Thorarchaeota archaeon]
MTLAANEPTDQRQVSELPAYIRENRVAINAISGAGNVGVTDLTLAAGSTSLVVGTDVGAYGYETVKVTGTGAATLTKITGGTEGQVKVFVFQDALVKLTDGNVKSGGEFYLNQLPAGSNFEPQQDDIIALVNIGGDGGTTYGYWKELYRTISLK